jgi:hypothetical protein
VGTETSAEAASGFSLIEALVASAILLCVTLGLLPLWTRATLDNLAASRSGRASDHARSRIEALLRLPFDSPELALSGGTARTTVEGLARGSDRWRRLDGPPGSAPPGTEWIRTTAVRWYSIAAFADGELTDAEALPSGAPRDAVDCKGLRVVVALARPGRSPAGGPRVAFEALRCR